MKTELSKDHEAALRYADGEKGIEYMNVQLAAFAAGVMYARSNSNEAALRYALESIAGLTMRHVMDGEHGFERCREIASDALANTNVQPRGRPLDS